MKPPTFLTNLPAIVCYKSIKTLYRQSFYYCIYSQSSNCFCGRKKKIFLELQYQKCPKDEAQYWLDRALEKLLKIFPINPLKWGAPYCVKTEEGMGEIGIGLPISSPPSYDFIDRKSLLLLINKFIDYNDRIYSTPIPISSKSIVEIKNNHQGERHACSVDKYQAFKMPLSLLKGVRALAIMLSSNTQVIMPAPTTNFFSKPHPASR